MNFSKLKSDVLKNKSDWVWGFIILFVINNFAVGCFFMPNIFAMFGCAAGALLSSLGILLVLILIASIPYFIFKQNINAYRITIFVLLGLWILNEFLA